MELLLTNLRVSGNSVLRTETKGILRDEQVVRRIRNDITGGALSRKVGGMEGTTELEQRESKSPSKLRLPRSIRR